MGYWIPRRNIICGRWIKHAGWYPDRQLDCCAKATPVTNRCCRCTRWLELDGLAGTLTEPLIHLNYRSLSEFWQRQRRYARIAAAGMIAAWRAPRVRAPSLANRYANSRDGSFSESGYGEGPLGLALCLWWLAGTFETYARSACFSRA